MYFVFSSTSSFNRRNSHIVFTKTEVNDVAWIRVFKCISSSVFHVRTRAYLSSQTNWRFIWTVFENLNPLICFYNAGIVRSFFKCSDQKSISACLLPKRLYRCHHFIPAFSFMCVADIFCHPTFDMHRKQDRSKSTNHSLLTLTI